MSLVIITITFLSLALLQASARPTAAEAAQFKAKSVATDLSVGIDARLRVAQAILAEAGQSQLVLHLPQPKKAEITNFIVRQGSRPLLFSESPKPGTYLGQRRKEELVVTIHLRPSDSPSQIFISYEVTDAVVAYEDALDLLWPVWSQGQGSPGEVSIHADALPEADPSDGKIFARSQGQPLSGDLEYSPSGPTLALESAPENEEIMARAIMPKGGLLNERAGHTRPEKARSRLIEEEESRTGQAAASRPAQLLTGMILPLILLMALAALVLVRSGLPGQRRHSAPRPEVKTPPPGRPLEAAILARGRGTDHSLPSMAVFFDLLRRGYFEAIPSANLAGQLDLWISEAQVRPISSALSAHERAVLAFFDDLLDGGPGALGDLGRNLDPASLQSRWAQLGAIALESEEALLGRPLRDTRRIRLLIALLALSLAPIGIVLGGGPGVAILPILSALALWRCPESWIQGPRPEVAGRIEEWRAYTRYLERQFAADPDAPGLSLEGWQRTLVLAVALGLAKELALSGRMPDRQEDPLLSVGDLFRRDGGLGFLAVLKA